MIPPLRCPALALALVLGAASLRAAEPPPAPTVITSDSCDSQSSDTETTSHFEGHVVVVGTNLRIDCDHMTVISSRTGDTDATFGQQNNFKYILATGHVVIVQGDREAHCGQAEVLPEENKITLTQSPVVTDHGNGSVITGEPLVLYRNERRVTGKHVHITAPPMKDLGFNPDQPPPAPEPNPPAPAPATP